MLLVEEICWCEIRVKVVNVEGLSVGVVVGAEKM